MTAPPRRGFLAAVGGAALASPATALPLSATSLADAPAADADLIAECNRAIAAHHECEACYCYPLTLTAEEARPFEAKADAFTEVAWEHGERALDMPAVTLAGILAKSRAARALVGQRTDGTPLTNGLGDELAWGALEDLETLVTRLTGGTS